MDNRECRKCRSIKPITEFYTVKRNKGGRSWHCKVCDRVAQKKIRDKNAGSVTVSEKACSTCRTVKSIGEFSKNRVRKDGHASRCKSCDRVSNQNLSANPPEWLLSHNLKRQLKTLYGMTLEEYQTRLDKQQGVCSICGKPPSGGKKRLAVDHCHDTGEVRGLLCGLCNSGIAHLRHSTELMESAISYLRETDPKYREVI